MGQDKGAAPTELEEEVAKALLDLEVAPQSDIKADLRDIYISNAQDVEVKSRTALVIHVPFRAWKSVKKVHGRLIRELEKKFSKKHVVFVASRTIMDKTFRRGGKSNMKIRPRNRPLPSVHESILEDVVGPTEIVGKRTRISVDGTKLMKVILDPKDKDKKHRVEVVHLRRGVQEVDDEGLRLPLPRPVRTPAGGLSWTLWRVLQ